MSNEANSRRDMTLRDCSLLGTKQNLVIWISPLFTPDIQTEKLGKLLKEEEEVVVVVVAAD